MRVVAARSFMLLMLMRVLPGAAAAEMLHVRAGRGGVRSGPGAAYDIIGAVRQGETYTSLDRRDEWYLIRLVDGREGWIHEKLMATARSLGTDRSRPPPPERQATGEGLYRQVWSAKNKLLPS
jgi:uncharacterized protein YraI